MNTSFCKNAVIFIDIYASKFDSELCFACLYHLRSCFIDLILSVNYIENEHDTLSIIIRPTIHALAQLSSEKLLIAPQNLMSVVFISLIVTLDLLLTSNCKT